MKKILLLAALAAFGTTSGQTLSKAEQKITASVDAAMPATLQLLKESVDINSGTFNITGVQKTGDCLQKN